MTASALIHGKLVRDPAQKISKGGKVFASALLKEGDGEAATWWSLLAFSQEVMEELASLRAGDALAASGSFKAEVYEKNGERRVSFSLFADRVISARKQKRERQGRQAEDPQDRSQAGRFDDGLPL